MRPRFAQRMPAFLAFVLPFVPHLADEELGLGSVLLNPFLRPLSDLRYRLLVFLRSHGNCVFQSVLPSFFRLGRRLWKYHTVFRFRRRNYSGFFLGTVRAVEIPSGKSGMFSRPLSRDDVQNLSADVDTCGDLRCGLDSFSGGRFLVLRFLQSNGFRLLFLNFRFRFEFRELVFAFGRLVLRAYFGLRRFVVLFCFEAFRSVASSAGRQEYDERCGEHDYREFFHLRFWLFVTEVGKRWRRRIAIPDSRNEFSSIGGRVVRCMPSTGISESFRVSIYTTRSPEEEHFSRFFRLVTGFIHAELLRAVTSPLHDARR